MRFDARAPLRRLARLSCLLGAAVALAVVAGCGSDSDEGAQGGAAKAGSDTLTMGFLYDIGSANAWTTDCGLQYKAFMMYVTERYGTLGNALAFHNSHGWY